MTSHRQIFKSTALIGGTQVIKMAIGIVRNKVLAMLLGPAGTAVAGLYMTATGLIGSVAGLGINGSGVRQIAEAAGTNDETRIARTIITLRRVALISGLFGMTLVLALAPLLSRSTFGDRNHVFGISLMSLTLLFGGISAGQSALLQGLRRLRDLAASQVFGTCFGAVVSVALVWWLGQQGIVPFLVVFSAFGILLSWWYARMQRRAPQYAVVTGKGYRPRLIALSGGGKALAIAFIGSFLFLSQILPLLVIVWTSTIQFPEPPTAQAIASMSVAIGNLILHLWRTSTMAIQEIKAFSDKARADKDLGARLRASQKIRELLKLAKEVGFELDEVELYPPNEPQFTADQLSEKLADALLRS